MFRHLGFRWNAPGSSELAMVGLRASGYRRTCVRIFSQGGMSFTYASLADSDALSKALAERPRRTS